MKALNEFKYFSPMTTAEAIALLDEYQEEAKIIAGGTDLLPLMKDRIVTPNYIVDLKNIPDLEYLDWDAKNGLRIGALTRIVTILDSKLIEDKYLSLHEAAGSLGAIQVRNMATIGGNICRSSPSADMVPPMLVFDAEAKLVGSAGERTMRLEEFFTGVGRNVLNNEILTEIKLLQPRRCSSAFKKMARTSEDLAKVNCAVRVTLARGKFEDISIALGAVAPTPVRAKRVEQALLGQIANMETIKDAVTKVCEDISPINDCRSTAEYRSHVSKVLLVRTLMEAIKRIEA